MYTNFTDSFTVDVLFLFNAFVFLRQRLQKYNLSLDPTLASDELPTKNRTFDRIYPKQSQTFRYFNLSFKHARDEIFIMDVDD